ncbi:MAG TPA: rhamnulokinase family protein [Cellulomonas sp.]
MSTQHGALVAVDLGASSGRVVVGRLVGGRLETTEVARFPNGPVPLPAGDGERLRTDVLGLWSGIRTGLRDAVREHGPVASIGIDTWGVDFALLDADGALLGDPTHYRDTRTEGVPARFAEVLPVDEHYARTGTQVQPFNTVYQVAAAAGTVQGRVAERLLLLPDLLGHWLTGAHVTERTNASTTGMLDVRTGDWSPEVLDALARLTGQDVKRLLAPVVAPATVVGEVRRSVTPDLGPGLGARSVTGGGGRAGGHLDGARLVTVGSHDTASAVAAAPMDGAASAYISSGTWSLVGVELDAPVLTEAGRAANFTNELGVAGTVRYLRNVAGLWLLQECLRTWRAAGLSVDLPEVLAAAAHAPALRTVLDVDDPVFAPPGDMPARIAAAARRTGQPVPTDPAAVARCVLDSLALAYRRAVRAAVALSGREVRTVHVVGGGARNALLCRLTADATGLPVVAGPAEATAIGNLLTQALALGAVDGGLAGVREVVRASTPVTRWDPAGDDTAWQQADHRLRDAGPARSNEG